MGLDPVFVNFDCERPDQALIGNDGPTDQNNVDLF